MSMANNVRNFLDRTGIHYSVDRHPLALTSLRTAQVAHVSGEQIAKGVLLKDAAGYVLAVVPATHHVRMGQLHGQLGRDLEAAPADDLADVFSDCEMGAVPALGPAYDLDTVVDPSLRGQQDIYFEGGDHQELVHMAGEDFEELMEDAKFMSCSVHHA
jgi:Ala-tRNA(Pro) deacylase